MKPIERFIIKPGEKVKLADHDPGFTGEFADKETAKEAQQANTERMAELQRKFYADNSRALLLVLQAMDAGGKDGTIRHVMSGMNPQGCRVTSFKAPTEEELDHDFLWRIHRAVPRLGEIGIFNRSHYEDVLVVRVHNLAPESVWSKRYDQINHFEKLLADNNVTILKFFLHISKDEQLERFEKRVNDPEKHWKVNPADFEERKFWDDYMHAYEVALTKCSTPWAPWFIIPANKKWYRNVAISQIILSTMESMDMRYPPPPSNLEELKIACGLVE